MNRHELRQSLNVSDRRLSEWIKAGLPRSRTRPGAAHDYDPATVSAWLIQNGHAEAPRVAQTIEELAQHFHRTPRQVRELDQRGDARQHGRAVGLGRRGRAARQPPGAGRQRPPVDWPDFATLERYREHRAELARLEVLERKRVLIDRRQIEPTMQRFAQVMRSAVETLQRQFGPEAAKTIDDALIDSLRVVDSLQANDGSNSPIPPAENE